MLSPKILYQPRATFLHRLNPLVKLAWLIVVGTVVFVVPRVSVVIGLLIGILVLYPLAHLRIKRDVRGIRILVSMSILLFGLQILFNHEGTSLFHLWSFISVTDVGLRSGITVGARFLIVVLSSYLFVATTDPSELACALMRVGLPYRYGFALITALRLAPIFEVEGATVYQAQLARGVRYDVRSPLRLFTLMRQFFFPLLVSALTKVDAIAVSMEGRCFGKYPTRTFVRQARFGWQDGVALAILVAGIVAAGFQAL